ncbi:MAG: cyclic pyranopterin monophosphate synthase MoaC [Methanomassiliicoccales archaeon]|nr:cyclic pyranopterin monophosphate synthase MoaC [Methanomassiliicoccales archaeon]
MVDIGEKEVVRRKAVATGKIVLGKASIDAIRSGTVKKGDVLEAAKIAAIQAVKSTPDIVPYCHPIPVESIRVGFDVAEGSLTCHVEVNAHYKTGVEMEALIGVSVALLTVWDMVKYLEKDRKGQYPDTSITDIRVVSKEKGGITLGI